MPFKEPSQSFDPPTPYNPDEADRGAVLEKGNTDTHKVTPMIERPEMPAWLDPTVTSARNVADEVVSTRAVELGDTILNTISDDSASDQRYQRLAS